MKRDRKPAVALRTLDPGIVTGDRYPAFVGTEFAPQEAEPSQRLNGALASRRRSERDVIDAVGTKTTELVGEFRAGRQEIIGPGQEAVADDRIRQPRPFGAPCGDR